VKKAEVESCKRAGQPSDAAARMNELERENRELRQANEILRSRNGSAPQPAATAPNTATKNRWSKLKTG